MMEMRRELHGHREEECSRLRGQQVQEPQEGGRLAQLSGRKCLVTQARGRRGSLITVAPLGPRNKGGLHFKRSGKPFEVPDQRADIPDSILKR